MKLYKTMANTVEGPSVRWAGSQAEAASQRKAFNASGIKRADVTTDVVEVPTNKAGLLEFLDNGG